LSLSGVCSIFHSPAAPAAGGEAMVGRAGVLINTGIAGSSLAKFCPLGLRPARVPVPLRMDNGESTSAM